MEARAGAGWGFVAALAVTLLAAACSGGGDGDDDSLAQLSVGAEVVEVVRDDEPEEVATDETRDLDPGDTVLTDTTGRGQIDYADGSFTRLGAVTEFRLVELAEREGPRVTITDLDAGETYHRVAELTESGDRFEVQTASATAAVTGTVFVVSCLATGECVVIVLEGEVIVTFADGSSVTLTAGQAVTISADGVPGEVQTLSPDELAADEWIAENVELDIDAGLDIPEAVVGAAAFADSGERDGQAGGDTLAAALIAGTWSVELEAVTVDGFRDVAVGDVRTRTYEIDTDCDDLLCRLTIDLAGADREFRLLLEYTGTGYRVTVPGLGTQDCLRDDESVAVQDGIESTATLELEVAAAELNGDELRATTLTGTANETAEPVVDDEACSSGEVTYVVTATRVT